MINKSFYFLRHGQTDWNKKNIAMGQKDISLNNLGIKEAQNARKLLINYEFNSIACSPLKRAMQTANIINKDNKYELHVIDELKEACWGIMEGKNKTDNHWIKRWRKGLNIIGAEQYTHFKSRIYQGLQKSLSLSEPTLIISHGGVYWAIQEILNLPLDDLHNAIPVYHRPPLETISQWFICHLDDGDYL